MRGSATRTIVHRYYDAWAAREQEPVRSLLDENLDFRSPQDKIDGVSEFLGKCWVYSKGLKAVHYLREVYADDQAFVILSWEMEDGSRFVGAEYVRIRDGRIGQIIVVNNSSEFSKLMD